MVSPDQAKSSRGADQPAGAPLPTMMRHLRRSGWRRRGKEHVAAVAARHPHRGQFPALARDSAQRGNRSRTDGTGAGSSSLSTRSASTRMSAPQSLAELSSTSPSPPPVRMPTPASPRRARLDGGHVALGRRQRGVDDGGADGRAEVRSRRRGRSRARGRSWRQRSRVADRREDVAESPPLVRGQVDGPAEGGGVEAVDECAPWSGLDSGSRVLHASRTRANRRLRDRRAWCPEMRNGLTREREHGADCPARQLVHSLRRPTRLDADDGRRPARPPSHGPTADQGSTDSAPACALNSQAPEARPKSVRLPCRQ